MEECKYLRVDMHNFRSGRTRLGIVYIVEWRWRGWSWRVGRKLRIDVNLVLSWSSNLVLRWWWRSCLKITLGIWMGHWVFNISTICKQLFHISGKKRFKIIRIVVMLCFQNLKHMVAALSVQGFNEHFSSVSFLDVVVILSHNTEQIYLIMRTLLKKVWKEEARNL